MLPHPHGNDRHPWASRLTDAEQRIAALEAANARLARELSRLLALVSTMSPPHPERVG